MSPKINLAFLENRTPGCTTRSLDITWKILLFIYEQVGYGGKASEYVRFESRKENWLSSG
jgi:hypothetical protein